MEINIGSRIKKAWNAFFSRDPTSDYRIPGIGYSYRPDRARLRRGGERSIVNSIYNRIALDASSYTIEHVKVDSDGKFLSQINSPLNDCLNLSANKDQIGRAFRHDVFLSCMDEGCVAVVPVDASEDPEMTDGYKIYSMRVGEILEWKPDHVKVRLYNDKTGNKEDLWFPKRWVAVVENPFYSVMNEPNSTMSRLIRKLSLLDIVDEHASSEKLDLIIQVPYTIKSPAKQKFANERREELERQMAASKYGIGYIDSTEHVIQLNRPVENNLLKQIEYLTNQVLSELGMTTEILNGTADEKIMQNYYTRIVEPFLDYFVDAMKRSFLSPTARSQGQSIMYFRDPFKLMPISSISDVANSLKRNEIVTTNEFRQAIGMKPSKDEKADELRNSNMPETTNTGNSKETQPTVKEETNQNGEMGL